MKKINQAEWMAELDKLRNKPSNFTPGIDQVILYARDGDPKVSYPELLKFIRDKFGWQGSRTTLRDRYITLKKLPA